MLGLNLLPCMPLMVVTLILAPILVLLRIKAIMEEKWGILRERDQLAPTMA